MLVLRDQSTSECYLVDFETTELDLERLDEANLEIAGRLRTPNVSIDYDKNDEEDSSVLLFTTCEYVINPDIPANDNATPNRFCNKWILEIDGGAPEFCTEHTDNANKEG